MGIPFCNIYSNSLSNLKRWRVLCLLNSVCSVNFFSEDFISVVLKAVNVEGVKPRQYYLS